ncbi:competence protein ComK [Macrococcus animalis]|uniref:competence protein ComK n=1 Tax=Macrococcus animalis TaxID=3395467 RepID=UPI0039BFC19F
MLTLPLCATDMCIYQRPSLEGKTEIMTLTKENRIVDERPEKLLEDTLTYFGSNIKTRKQSVKILTGQAHHLPIMIEASLEWIYYPIHQKKTHFQLYINPKMIYHFEGNKEKSIIYFVNNESIEIPQHISFIQKQHQKALVLADLQMKIIKRQLHLSNYRLD